ncbi:uroporphyrinogen-III C-methyltransferase [Frischella sp. Ac48]|uniref:Siroheme synthase n=1 Tax=Frischella japonica TaxID=2741544 RepID=A0ABR7R0F9_9GAMM|nr:MULTISPECIES: siroheme synthase CysG [Frischella]MBC9131791.1 uroporphyrinogen-III C-methyltransferase [Frischella japonica]MBX4132683.1 uroporphyrinogen-III C-methyltransferase [Frischella sp. Ac48]
MDYFPLFCKLENRDCLLVGGGEVAERKARLLLDAGARVTVNAKAFNQQFICWQEQQQLTLVSGDFSVALLDNKWLVIAATNDASINQRVSTEAEKRRIFCNVVDSPKEASFIMPSIVDRSPIMVAVSSEGHAPVLARLLREKLEAILPQHLGKLADYAGYLRQKVKQKYQTMIERRRFWEKLFTHDRLAQALANHDSDQVERLTHELFDTELEHRGEVVLVGAGPGDPGLLTLKGLQQIQQADIIVYDRLVSDEIMALTRRDAQRVFVGKRAGFHCVPQEQINQMLLEQAQKGRRVVRLKGGDPFIFGRGGEELETLFQANIPFSVVPGITAASGCSAYSGIPLTHRDYAHSVRLVTGHLKDGSHLDWQSLAAEKQTLVFYMGLSQAEAISQQLIKHGMDINMPVAIIEAGTTIKQKVLTGLLKDLTQLALQVHSPSLIIVGTVVALRKQLNWFSEH